MNQFVQRVVNYVANEIIIKGLANSRTFQRFAVRTNKQYEDFAKNGTENLSQTIEEMANQQASNATKQSGTSSATSSLEPPKPPLRGIPGFFLAFFKEVRRDVTGS